MRIQVRYLWIYITYGIFFVCGLLLYLILPAFGFDDKSGLVYFDFPDLDYFYLVLSYFSGYQIGFLFSYIFYLLGKSPMDWASLPRRGSGSYITVLYFTAFIFVLYSLISRNIFSGVGGSTFTIIGFDLLLALYYINRSSRPLKLNLFYFFGLSLLFLYAGFRYRLFLLIGVECIVYIFYIRSIIKRALVIGLGFLFTSAMLSYGEFRKYGSFEGFDFYAILNLKIINAFFVSGEQTVYYATRSIIQYEEYLNIVYFEPLVVALTHFIPSFLYSDKPRVTYLGYYQLFTPELTNTGAAMHDIAQSLLMFGSSYVILSSMILGSLAGFFFAITVYRSPSKYYILLLCILYGFFTQSRGYFIQQLTWWIVFLLPVLYFSFSIKLKNTYGSP